jgi:C4-dicarboxylate-binding protein DctP
MLQDLTFNGIQGLVEPAAFLGGFKAGACVVNLPFLFPDAKTEMDILNNTPCGDAYREYLRSVNIDVLDWYIYGVNRGFNTKFPITKDVNLADAFKGRKIRVMGSQILLDQANLLGASAVTMDVPEVYTSLQQGTIEGMGVAPIFTAQGSYYEVAPYMFIGDGDFEISQFMVSAEWLDSLPEDLYKVVKEAAKKIQPRTVEYAYQAQEDCIKKIEDNGGTVTWGSEAQINELNELAKVITERFLKDNPDVQDVYNSIVKEVAAYKK